MKGTALESHCLARPLTMQHVLAVDYSSLLYTHDPAAVQHAVHMVHSLKSDPPVSNLVFPKLHPAVRTAELV